MLRYHSWRGIFRFEKEKKILQNGELGDWYGKVRLVGWSRSSVRL